MGDAADIDLSASTQKGSYSSLGVSGAWRWHAHALRCGPASHPKHRRYPVDDRYRGCARCASARLWLAHPQQRCSGKAVIADIGSYQRTSASVDLERLPANVEATQSVTQLTLTEGAIGYRSLEVISGEKAMAVLRLPDSSAPPFGATVKNLRQQDTGIVNDDGHVYLSGIQAGERMIVSWGGAERCTVTLPTILPMDGLTDALNLRCQLLAADQSSTDPAALTGTPIDTENTSS